MIDITYKTTTQRRAIAEAAVYCDPAALALVEQGKVPKGNVLEISRAAGLLAIKRTPDLLPFCHPIPVEYADISYRIEEDCIRIRVEAECIYRTGIEVETMTAASIVALNIYDMLKPVAEDIRIGDIRVLEKSGGKNDFGRIDRGVRAAVVVCGDAYRDGRKETASGDIARELLSGFGIEADPLSVVGGDAQNIAAEVSAHCDDGVDFVFTVGGTGLDDADMAVAAARDLIEMEIPGVAEAMRAHGQARTPYAALSRSVVGKRGRTLIVTLPGSKRGVRESIDALFPWLLHVIRGFDTTAK